MLKRTYLEQMLGRGKIVFEAEEEHLGETRALFYLPGLTSEGGLFAKDDTRDIFTNVLKSLYTVGNQLGFARSLRFDPQARAQRHGPHKSFRYSSQPQKGLWRSTRQDKEDQAAREQSMTQQFETPDSDVDLLIRRKGLVVVLLDSEGRKIVYSLNYRNKLPETFTELVERAFKIEPEDTILWASSVFNEGREAQASEVLLGYRLPVRAGKKPVTGSTAAPTPLQKKQAAQKWAHPKELSPEELRWLMGGAPPK